jgi:hypothetical protein
VAAKAFPIGDVSAIQGELAVLVVDAATQERPLSEPTGDWREDLQTVALWMRQSSVAHPAIADLRRSLTQSPIRVHAQMN